MPGRYVNDPIGRTTLVLVVLLFLVVAWQVKTVEQLEDRLERMAVVCGVEFAE